MVAVAHPGFGGEVARASPESAILSAVIFNALERRVVPGGVHRDPGEHRSVVLPSRGECVEDALSTW
ncbi:hypothetical protein FRAHR75_40165 [Frankia sp. Hr75.2]|nr:hypothetical protein FRAHR75_40165 [Frankia sp. Hr75.2]